MKETHFKNTEIGAIPMDWALVSLNDIGYWSKGSGISRQEALSGIIPAIRYGEIYTTHNCIIRNIISFISSEVSSNAKLIKKGDLLFTASGETKADIGKCVAYIFDFEAYAGGDIIVLSPTQACCSEYMGYALNQENVLKQKESLGQGDAVVHITTQALQTVKVAMPTHIEQERIAAALSDVDALIQELGELIEKKRLIKQGAMQQLLSGTIRLPDFSKPWVKHRLGEIGIFSKGKGISKSETTSDGLPCIRYGEIYTTHHDYIKSFVSYISPQTAIDSVSLQKGQILFTASGETKEDIGKAVAFNLDLDAYVGGDIIIFTPSMPLDAIFMGYAMNTPNVNGQKSALGQGDAVVHIGTDSLASISIYIPEITEQQAIAEVLTDMDNEIAELEFKREKYQSIKQGMMQELLTGRIRLVKPSVSNDLKTYCHEPSVTRLAAEP